MGVIKSNLKFQASDIDMVMQRKNKFLFAEWKRDGQELKDMKDGQKILLKSLSNQDNNTVWIIEGYSLPSERHIGRIYKLKQNKIILLGTGESCLLKKINAWYDYAENS
jgi:hypothetical protein